MKKSTTISLSIATFGAVGLSASFVMAGQPTQQWHVKDHSAFGSAYEYDGCESTGVDISGSESSSHGGGGQVQDNGAWAGYYSYNWCTGSQVSGYAWIPGGFSGDMQGATIDVELEADSYEYAEIEGQWVYNYLGTVTVEINAEFTGIGKAEHGRNSSYSRWGSSYSRYRWSGQTREATLDLTVTVDGDSVDLTNPTGSLSKSNSGSIYLYEESRRSPSAVD
jgi:hypothetical protein